MRLWKDKLRPRDRELVIRSASYSVLSLIIPHTFLVYQRLAVLLLEVSGVNATEAIEHVLGKSRSPIKRKSQRIRQ